MPAFLGVEMAQGPNGTHTVDKVQEVSVMVGIRSGTEVDRRRRPNTFNEVPVKVHVVGTEHIENSGVVFVCLRVKCTEGI